CPIPFDLWLLLKVKATCLAFHVDHVRVGRCRKAEDDERSVHSGMRTGAETEHLHADVRTLSQFCDVLKLTAHHVSPADLAADDRFVQHCPYLGRIVGGQPLLAWR